MERIIKAVSEAADYAVDNRYKEASEQLCVAIHFLSLIIEADEKYAESCKEMMTHVTGIVQIIRYDEEQ